MMRHRLANRRHHETFSIDHDRQRFKISLGREVTRALSFDERGGSFVMGPVLEVFLSAQKPNSEVDVLASDGAILMSLLLQHGCPIETIHHAMKRNPDGSPSSPLGRAAALIAEASHDQ